MTIAAMMLVTTLALVQTAGAPPPASATQQLDERGAHGMGFDQQKTRHHFLLYQDGGAIDVLVKDEADTANRDAIRAHLPHIAMLFGQGDFDLPHFIHATDVPGTQDMARLKDRISYRYVETAGGGRVDIVTSDAEALEAVHAFLRFQITDHRTGDSLAVGVR